MRRFFSKVIADDENADSMVAIIMMDEATLETMRLMHAILMRTQLTRIAGESPRSLVVG